MILTEKPSWFYKLIEIKNFVEIQEELKQALYQINPNFDNEIPNYFYHPKDKLETLVPKYMEYMDSIGVLHRWRGSSIISTNYGMKFPIHIDSENWLEVSYGLNIPVINCEGTYTVWYDATVSTTYVDKLGVPKERMTKYIDNTKPIVEIERLEMIQPAWINVSIPHAPVSTHNKPRAIFSARFEPELHDILYKQ
jgi:hypothetical protein